MCRARNNVGIPGVPATTKPTSGRDEKIITSFRDGFVFELKKRRRPIDKSAVAVALCNVRLRRNPKKNATPPLYITRRADTRALLLNIAKKNSIAWLFSTNFGLNGKLSVDYKL